MRIIPGQYRMLIICCLALSAACRERPGGASERVGEGSTRESPRPSMPGSRVPTSRGGEDMLGLRLPLDGLKWLNTRDGASVDVTGKVTLVRWWTDSCPFCAASLPAIEALTRRYGSAGFQAVGVYHPKPPRHVEAAEVLRSARALGYTGPVATDLDWATLNRVYLSTGNRVSTSVSFILDRNGIIRFINRGPEFRPTDDPAMAEINRDYEDIRSAIEALLAEKLD